MQDYGQKLQQALDNAIRIGSQSASVLLSKDDEDWKHVHFSSSKMNLDWSSNSSSPSLIVLYNSDGHHRTEMIQLETSWPYVRVFDPDGKKVKHQINPGRSSDSFHLVFIAGLAPLSLSSYRIEKMPNTSSNRNAKTMAVMLYSSNVTLKWPFSSHQVEDTSVDILVYNLLNIHLI